MALDKRSKHKNKHVEEEESLGELATLVENVKENPFMYAAAGAFVIVCIVGALLYKAYSIQQEGEQASEYARALQNEDPALLAEALEPVAVSRGAIGAEALYMMGEAAFRAKDYEKAKVAFEGLRADHSDSVFVADAVEGLGFVAEEAGDYEEAQAKYQEILDKWPKTFAARRQHVNLARVYEELGKIEEAVAAYKEQASAWPESHVAGNADVALARLEAAHPELFPEEPVEEPTFEAPEAADSKEPAPEASEPAASEESAPATEEPEPAVQ
jgi:tetratricopeptide (TPR) repeat protein